MIDRNAGRSTPSLAMLCRKTGRSASSLQHEFKKHFNTTLSSYMKSQRIHLARSLLASNARMTVAHVATRCGYRSVSLFHRHFREITGLTPGKTRFASMS